MKVTQTCMRNTPSSVLGESMTLTTVYSSFDRSEIDELEKVMPKGILVMDGEKWQKETGIDRPELPSAGEA